MESSTTRAQDNSSDEGANTSSHVHRTTTGEIDSTRSPKWIGCSGGKDTIHTPEGVRHHWVAKANEESRIEQIGQLKERKKVSGESVNFK